MLPPGWLCEALHRIHPQLRIAWAGREKRHADELNPGSFAIVQLYHIKDVGTEGEPLQYRTRWDVDFENDSLGNPYPKRVYRGPIFSKNGSARPDWDPLFRKPVYAANLEDFGFSIERQLNGDFFPAIKEWLTPIKRRIVESAKEEGRRLQCDADAMAGEMTDFLWREAQKSDAASVTQAYKHSKEDIAKLEKRKEFGNQLPSYYMPPGV